VKRKLSTCLAGLLWSGVASAQIEIEVLVVSAATPNDFAPSPAPCCAH